MKIIIIGGGITGLAAGYYLSKKGYMVELFESSYFLGGQASAINLDGNDIERAYHHIFKNDHEIIKLMDELGILNKLKWYRSSVGIFSKNRLFKFSSPRDLLTFPHLSMFNRVWLGIVSLYLMRVKNWNKYEYITASKWIKKYAGSQIYNVMWGPLLKSKFGKYYELIGMPWFWSKMKTRFASRDAKGNEVLGYIDGSFEILINKLKKEIINNGGSINLNSKILKINTLNSKIKSVTCENKNNAYQAYGDIIINTAPSFEITKMIDFNSYYKKKLQTAKYIGASVFILSLKESLTPYYWLNITDKNIPFLGLIEHTNLVPVDHYQGKHILYITNYLSNDDPVFSTDKKVLINKYYQYLKIINPKFTEDWVYDYTYNSVSAAQPIIPIGYNNNKPDYTSPIKNLYIGNTTQIYPEDRGTNYSVKIAGEIVSLIIENGVEYEKE